MCLRRSMFVRASQEFFYVLLTMEPILASTVGIGSRVSAICHADHVSFSSV